MSSAIIGYGLIARKREQFIKKHSEIRYIYDVKKLKKKNYTNNYNLIFEDKKIKNIFISTIHSKLFFFAKLGLINNKNVFLEKPGGINSKELKELSRIQKKKKKVVFLGYNHRYHFSIIKAKKLLDKGVLGKIYFIKASYGHGGRVGYEKEWRFNKSLSGGGQLLDQGSHIIDLARYFLNSNFRVKHASLKNYFWNTKLEDNAFVELENNKHQKIFFHTSCSEWKNTFDMQIYGKFGKIKLEGLGGSYGTEKINFYKMSKKMGPPQTFCWEYPMQDNSWKIEVENFFKIIKKNKIKNYASLNDSIKNMSIIEECYKKNKL